MTKTICILLAEGFEESEAVVPADLLKRLGVNVVFTSINNKVYAPLAYLFVSGAFFCRKLTYKVTFYDYILTQSHAKCNTLSKKIENFFKKSLDK